MSILALTSDTLVGTPGAGQIEYNGQFFGTDSNASRAQLQRITQGTAVASTSGTSIDFTGLPAWVKKITVMLSGVSTSGTSALLFQLGDSGGVEVSGYISTGIYINGPTGTAYTTGFGIPLVNSTDPFTGSIVFTNYNTTNGWIGNGSLTDPGTRAWIVTGHKSTSATLDRVRITTVNGTDTFDAGSINIIYEG
jgi:hypothetical protein